LTKILEPYNKAVEKFAIKTASDVLRLKNKLHIRMNGQAKINAGETTLESSGLPNCATSLFTLTASHEVQELYKFKKNEDNMALVKKTYHSEVKKIMTKVAQIEIGVASYKLACEFLWRAYLFCRGHNATNLDMTKEVNIILGTRAELADKNAKKLIKKLLKEMPESTIKD